MAASHPGIERRRFPGRRRIRRPGATGIMLVMTIQAVVFDIGGVLEITPDLGVTGMWESRLGLGPGELDKRMYNVWRGGSIGTVSERDVHQAALDILGAAGQEPGELCLAEAASPALGNNGGWDCRYDAAQQGVVVGPTSASRPGRRRSAPRSRR